MPVIEPRSGDIPTPRNLTPVEIFETFWVPAVFAPWAENTVEAGRLGRGDRVLDVACGTGCVAREALQRVGPTGRVDGFDLSEEMLDVARANSAEIIWRQGSAESLPYEDDTFDAVLCQFGLMFFPDQVRAIQEMRRVLRPGGRAVVTVWDEVAECPANAALIEVYSRHFDDSIIERRRQPFSLGDTEHLAALFHDAGCAAFTIETRRKTSRYPSARQWAALSMRVWLEPQFLDDAALVETVVTEAEEALRRFVQPDGAVHAPGSAHIVCFQA